MPKGLQAGAAEVLGLHEGAGEVAAAAARGELEGVVAVGVHHARGERAEDFRAALGDEAQMAVRVEVVGDRDDRREQGACQLQLRGVVGHGTPRFHRPQPALAYPDSESCNSSPTGGGEGLPDLVGAA
ncbi:hypothetical protein RB200_37250 [Streptomyces sp. PmtG]